MIGNETVSRIRTPVSAPPHNTSWNSPRDRNSTSNWCWTYPLYLARRFW